MASAENPRRIVGLCMDCNWLGNSHWLLITCACFAGAIGIGGFWGGWSYWYGSRRTACFLAAVGLVLDLLGGLTGMLGQKCEYENSQSGRPITHTAIAGKMDTAFTARERTVLVAWGCRIPHPAHHPSPDAPPTPATALTTSAGTGRVSEALIAKFRE